MKIWQKRWARLLVFVGMAAALEAVEQDNVRFTALFTENGPPQGWTTREWNDVAQAAPPAGEWTVTDGVLQPGQRRGTWLLSERDYGDFILEFEIKLTDFGNSGIALRAPLRGDPAFDGMELQFADLRYNPQARDSELTGGIYRALAPRQQVYRPGEWNTCRIELRGERLKVTLNGELVQDADLNAQDQPVTRHDDSAAPLVKDRPRKGRIGFQHLSRSHEPVLIRKVRIAELP